MHMNRSNRDASSAVAVGSRDLPAITIGMTTYQAAPFLKASLRSLLAQTERNFRLVISDDGSSDRTAEICQSFAAVDSRIEFIRQGQNLGPRRNFEFVFSRCETDYFMWASHDDLWSPNFIESCLSSLKAEPEAGFAITSWIVESRTFPLLRRLFLPSMAFVEDPDPLTRVLAFTALPFTSFKDNLTYGVWRRWALETVIDDLRDKTRYYSIGGVANEYALLKFKGCLVAGASLRKRYRFVPPGSALEPLFTLLSFLKRGGGPPDLYPRYTQQDHRNDLRTVFWIAGLEESLIERILGGDSPGLHLNEDGWG